MIPLFCKTLAEATVQEIQLELVRRTQFNAFNGEAVVASLLSHRNLWEAVMMDRLSFSRPGKLPTSGLIKLRDLADNFWNVDTLYILAPSAKSARKLAEIAETDQWGGMVLVHDDPDNVDQALGGAEPKQAVVTIWWD